MSCDACGSVYYKGPPADLSGRCSSNVSFDVVITVWLNEAQTENWDLTGYTASGAISLLNSTTTLQVVTCNIYQGIAVATGIETTLVYAHVDQADVENLPTNTPLTISIKAYNPSTQFSFTVGSGTLTFAPLPGL